MATTSTAGRYVGAYRVPATEEVKAMLTTVRDGNYFDQVR